MRKYFRIKPLESDQKCLIEFGEEDLRQMKNTHILAAVFPLSIAEIRAKYREMFTVALAPSADENLAFATEKDSEPFWWLIRKTPVQKSFGKTYDEQQELLGRDEEVPTARVMTFTIIAHYLNAKERLFRNMFVRCSDMHSPGCRVRVGHLMLPFLDVLPSEMISGTK